MNKPNTKCRVCGKEYFCCSDSKEIGSWRTMACSQECYKEYMRRIEESRKPKNKEIKIDKKVETSVEEQPIVKMRYNKKKTVDETVKTEDII